MYALQQEIEVWYIIPAIRKAIAGCLVNDYNVSYEKVGKILGITKAAVSQYLKNKRAAKIKLHPKALKEVGVSCELLIKEKSNSKKEILRILRFIESKRLPSEVCDKHQNGILEDCEEIVLSPQV